MNKPVLKASALSLSAPVLQNTLGFFLKYIYLCLTRALLFFPPLCLSVVFGAPTSFSTWELSLSASDVARAPELTRLARVR